MFEYWDDDDGRLGFLKFLYTSPILGTPLNLRGDEVEKNKYMKKKNKNRMLYELEAQQNKIQKNKYKGKKILALDFGEKFCGVAFSLDGIMGVPVKVFDTQNLDEEIESLIKEKKPDFWVLGLPLSSDASENKICAKIRKIKKNVLEKRFSQQVFLVNERNSSQDFSHLEGRIDDLAALKILEFFLEQV